RMVGACLTFAHLFSFQVSYADLPLDSTLASPAATGTKLLMDAASIAMGFVKKKLGGGNDFSDDVVLRRGIIEVDFATGSLLLADKDKPIASQEFRALKRKYAGEGDLLISLQFQGNESWDITAQCSDEKRTLNHLLECILRKLSLEQIIDAGKDKGVMGLDKTIIKAGVLKRKAKTAYKVDERFIVLVPGKLLLFKGSDISSKRIRYVTTLTRARVEATHGQPSFQILVPNTKALSLAASSTDAAKEWILALEDAIEYANGQRPGNWSMQADAAAAAQMTRGQQGVSDEVYMNSRINRLDLVDGTAMSSNPRRPAGQSPEQFHAQPAPGNITQQNEEWRGSEAWNGVTGPETAGAMDPRKQNFRLMGTNYDPSGAYVQEYLATPSGGGSYSHQEASCGNHSFGGGPPQVFAGSQITSSGFARHDNPFERTTGATTSTQGVMQTDFSSQGGAMGGRYIDKPHNEAYGYTGPQGNTQRAFDNTIQGNFQSNMQSIPVGKSPYVEQHNIIMKVPMGGNSYASQPNNLRMNQPYNSYVNQQSNTLGIGKANNPYVNPQVNPYVDQQSNAQSNPNAENPYMDQQNNAIRGPNASNPLMDPQSRPYVNQQNNFLRAPNANNPFMDPQSRPYVDQQNNVLRAPNANNSYLEQPSSPFLDQRNHAVRAPLTDGRYKDQQGSGLRAPMDTENTAMSAPITKDFVDHPNSRTPFEMFKSPCSQPMATPENTYRQPLGMGSPGNPYGSAQDHTTASGSNHPFATSGGFAPLGNAPQFDSSGGGEMRGKGFGNTSYGPPYGSQAGHQPFPG
ncbi:hypothetical protein GOP47_0009729, partial [Adiantum capillus-veneris]